MTKKECKIQKGCKQIIAKVASLLKVIPNLKILFLSLASLESLRQFLCTYSKRLIKIKTLYFYTKSLFTINKYLF